MGEGGGDKGSRLKQERGEGRREVRASPISNSQG